MSLADRIRYFAMPKHPLFVAILILTAAGYFLITASADAEENAAKTDTAALTGEMQIRLVAAHNALRDEVGVPPLKWSDTLAAYARERADTIQRQDCKLQHREGEIYGENLAWSGRTNLFPDQVVAMWAKKADFYDYTTNSCARSKICAHYTQMVWRSTRAVGCARARCNKGEVWVCNYYPPGNWLGEWPY